MLLSQIFTDALRDKFANETNLIILTKGGDLQFDGAIVGYAFVEGTGAPLPDVTVRAELEGYEPVRTTSDRDGRFELSGLGVHRYGSELMNVTADATLPGSLGSFAYDDEGTPARSASSNLAERGCCFACGTPRSPRRFDCLRG